MIYEEIIRPSLPATTWEDESRTWTGMTMTWSAYSDQSIPRPTFPVLNWDREDMFWDTGVKWDTEQANYTEIIKSQTPVLEWDSGLTWDGVTTWDENGYNEIIKPT